MVYFAKWDLNWRQKNSDKVAGALYYEVETEKGTEEVYVPILKIRVLKDEPVIEPRKIIDSRGFSNYEPIKLEEALKLAEKRGGDFVVISPFSENTYIVYRLATEADVRRNNKNRRRIF